MAKFNLIVEVLDVYKDYYLTEDSLSRPVRNARPARDFEIPKFNVIVTGRNYNWSCRILDCWQLPSTSEPTDHAKWLAQTGNCE